MIDSITIERAEVRRIRLPLHKPFVTSFGVQSTREMVLLRLETDVGVGWGECPTLSEPVYTSEFNASASDVIVEHLLPRVAHPLRNPAAVAPALAGVKGHRSAKSAVEMAVVDAWLRAHDLALGDYLGVVRSRVPVGVSIGIHKSIDDLLAEVGAKVADGYARIKLKIQPGWDLEPVGAVRSAFGEALPLQVDANASYTLADARHLAKLDRYGLILLEQPLADTDLVQHARLAARVETPVCLDESIRDAADAAAAIDLGACSIVNIKPGRVGGYLEAKRIHDVCRAHGVAVWCGGLIESGLGRAANLALAGLPGFVLPGDISPSLHYFPFDITAPFEMADGHIEIPTGAGLGVEVDERALETATVSTRITDLART